MKKNSAEPYLITEESVLITKAEFDRVVACRARQAFAAHLSSDWQPIETAPLDGTKVLLWIPSWRNGLITCGHWYPAPYAKKRTPYWYNEVLRRHDYNSNNVFRQNPPTHWMPLPAPPEDVDASS